MAHEFDSKNFLKTLTSHPGVYQMLNATGDVLYVGKAKDLKKRVKSYFQRSNQTARIASLVQQINRVEVIVTSTENEALLLENNLIKQLKPKYNILFRDDKTYPYIFLSGEDKFPRLDFHRGTKKAKGRYFGPYPSAGAVRESLNLLQKLFRIRQCDDTFFRNRTRPCIQYQIKRCTAPCVGYIEQEKYQQNVDAAVLFLQGKSQQLLSELMAKMQNASQNLDFEEAARFRDEISNLRKIQERQYVFSAGRGDVDVMAALSQGGEICIHILFIRAGRMIGSHAYFPKSPKEVTLEEVMTEFIPQYYLSPNHHSDIPKEILVNNLPEERNWLAEVLSNEIGRKVVINRPTRGERVRWLKMAVQNAQNALTSHLADKTSFYKRFEALQQALDMDYLPQRIECFDISHTRGEATVGSCVVFTLEGPKREAYRRFNVEGITPGDDYGALYQTITRRYTRLKKENASIPDIIVIDGGKGQLHQASKVLEELQISGNVLLAIAKGAGRKSGLETLFRSGKETPINLSSQSIAFHLLQQVRDEAHRFAITLHKKHRAQGRITSPLQAIPGVGPKRRQQILVYFSGIKEVIQASIEELEKVPGINAELARRIYEQLHTH